MIRAVFTDVDGTLLNAERQLSPRTIHAIRAIAQHVTVVLASSRMPAAMRHLQVELDIARHPKRVRSISVADQGEQRPSQQQTPTRIQSWLPTCR